MTDVAEGMEVTKVSSADSTTAGKTVNWGTMSFGATAANRVLAIALADRDGSANAQVSSVSIGGVAATKVTGAEGTNGVAQRGFYQRSSDRGSA